MWRLGELGMAVALGVSGLAIGCGGESEPTTKHTPRPRPKFREPAAATQPAEVATSRSAEVMLRHAMNGRAPTASGPPADVTVPFTAPEEWVKKQTRFMTAAVYALPKVAGDPEDAELTVSFLVRRVPLQMNIDRWCAQFAFGEVKSRAEAVKRQALEGTKYPTTIVEISGGYRGGSMMQPAGPAKPGYRMLAAEIRTPDRPWYVKMVGPEQTVSYWEASFLRFVREAK